VRISATSYSYIVSFCLGCLILFLSSKAKANFDLECYLKNNCENRWTSTTSNPSTGSQIKINPSTVPLDVGFGIESLFYKDSVDLAVVHGTGRVGAAISPSNSEETFFGPPGYENFNDFLERKGLAKKYPNQKYTLAGAMRLIEKNGSGLNAYSLKLGAMVKYNKLTGGVMPGIGLNGVLGAITFGGSVYKDQTQLNDPVTGGEPYQRFNYQVTTYNLGLFLSSLVIDYSHLTLSDPDATDTSQVDLFTVSLFVKKFILTAAKRTENSARPYYNYATDLIENKQIKEDYFGGVQYSINKNFMIGGFYNYYLVQDLSFSLTIFF